MATKQRDLRLDFFRGLALMFIFIDHIPENVFSYFTLQAVGFYDAAEVFIFISGYTAALVYGHSLEAKGALFAVAQILRRVWQLYVAHIFLFVIFIAEVSYTVMAVNNPMYNDEMRVGDFLETPHVAVVKALLLQFQPTFLDILPVYILLLALFPLILLGLRHWPAFILAISFAAYLGVQITEISVPAYPEGHLWYFNPLAWQFLFVIGAALGYGQVRRWPLARVWRALLPVAALIFAVGVVVKLSWTIHGLWDPFPGVLLNVLWPVNKNNLSAVRLVPFLASVIVIVSLIAPEARFLRSAVARPWVICGQQSLEVFCLGILLSALGHFILTEYDSDLSTQVVVNLAGLVVMYLTAKLVAWYKIMGRERPRPESGVRAPSNEVSS